MFKSAVVRSLAHLTLCVAAAACGPDTLCSSGCGGAILLVSPSLPDSIADSAAAGTTAPRVDTIRVENGGSGDLRWAARVLHRGPWLTLQPDTGTAGLSPPLQVRADPTGLALGVYRDTVVVTASSGSAAVMVPVVFRIHP
jgi:BACON domain-containing protein